MARIAIAVLLGLLIVACGDGEGVPTVPTTDTGPGADATATPVGEATATPPGEATADELPTPTEDGMPEPSATPAADTACTREETRSPVIAACEELAELLGLSLGEIDLVLETPREWPNSCLGLAGPEEICSQVITPGYEVVLVTVEQGSLYTYHTNSAAAVRLADVDLIPD